MRNWQKVHDDSTQMESFLVREQVMDAIRKFFKGQGFREVETPMLIEVPGSEPYLEVFETEVELAGGGKKRAFLSTSPELFMKKLLVAGVGNMFQITKSFRNHEGWGGTHNSEFSILEWYRVKAGYQEIMEDVEDLLRAVGLGMGQGSKLKYQGREYDLGGAGERIRVAEAFDRYAGIGVETLLDERGLIEAAVDKGYQVDGQTRWEQVFNQILANEIEPELGKFDRPVFLCDYPASQAALARKKQDDPRFAERFEVYLAGMELGNAFGELGDVVEQRERMEADLAERVRLGKKAYGLDKDFLDALSWGMPDCSGIAMGVDRLIMLFADKKDIGEVMWFPLSEMFDLR